MNRNLKAREIMNPNPVTVSPNNSLVEAIKLLIDRRISGLPVIDEERRLVGMVSEKDVLRLLYDDSRGHWLVGDLMVTELRSFQADDDLADVCDCLMANHFRRVPILEGERLVGLISRADLMPTILELASEQVRED